MFCSTVIPTVGRATLTRAVYSVLNQDFFEADFEVIVVNDSGRPLSPADWQQSERVRILHTQCRERSVARNTGAAVADGRYFHFLDDDDWLLPGALASFWDLARRAPRPWLYGGYNFVDAAGKVLEESRPDEEGNCLVRLLSGEWLPIQASLIESGAFFAVGGFEHSMIPFEDSDLARQIALRGDVSGTNDMVANIVRSKVDSTGDYSILRHQGRRSRERLLSTPGAFSRVHQSAISREVNRPYWCGRVTAVYYGSGRANLRQRRLFTAFSRSFFGSVNILLAGRWALSPAFWRGATRQHVTRGFLCKHGLVSS